MQAHLLVKHRMNCSRYLLLSLKPGLEGENDDEGGNRERKEKEERERKKKGGGEEERRPDYS